MQLTSTRYSVYMYLENLIESLYLLIKNDYSGGGKATAKHLEDKTDDTNKQKMKICIKHLTKQDKSRRVRGFGPKEV